MSHDFDALGAYESDSESRRIAALEAAENKRAGGLSVLAGVAAAAGSLGALIMKFFTL